ncbi:MAG: inovirus Gp2 family protein [Hydrogenovibrio sp.]|uniref:inovirus Gp2 family protein n=1 Tax=Hydrogenovibrio sp. TaxID=2065821 RepID=UPI0028707983|nr:inovirus Gp2 family protein [Hydrogenovibrio sp.]MDR9500071.1 inovirus Gp2 family protein [Hydrogenovibrio sp.]
MLDYERHPSNRNLRLYHEAVYFNLPVMTDKGPLVLEYLERGAKVFMQAVHSHTRTAMFRFDLHFPKSFAHCDTRVISSFTDGLRKAIQRAQKPQPNQRRYPTTFNFIWVKEVGPESGRPHFHFALFLNRDAYFRLGKFNGESNLFGLILQQWANALGLPLSVCSGLVHAASNPKYVQLPVMYFDQNATDFQQQIMDGFFRLSYLFKSATKVFQNGDRNLGTSRVG